MIRIIVNRQRQRGGAVSRIAEKDLGYNLDIEAVSKYIYGLNRYIALVQKKLIQNNQNKTRINFAANCNKGVGLC